MKAEELLSSIVSIVNEALEIPIAKELEAELVGELKKRLDEPDSLGHGFILATIGGAFHIRHNDGDFGVHPLASSNTVNSDPIPDRPLPSVETRQTSPTSPVAVATPSQSAAVPSAGPAGPNAAPVLAGQTSGPAQGSPSQATT